MYLIPAQNLEISPIPQANPIFLVARNFNLPEFYCL